jgi:hypothetical protein
VRPLNTFYHISGTSSSSTAQDASQQLGLAGNLAGRLAGNGLPSQPSFLQGTANNGGQWGEDRDSREAGGADQLQGVFSKHAVRRSPRELQQSLKKKQLQKQDETNWEDDERYGWD